MDGLKQFNDVYGHANGDKAIQKSADILQCITAKECVIARLNGDELVVFIYGADDDGKQTALCMNPKKTEEQDLPNIPVVEK